MGSIIIESSNFLVTFVGIWMLYKFVLWRGSNIITDENKALITAIMLLVAAVTVAALWFAMSRHLGNGDIWNGAMFEWRWLMKAVVGPVYAFACLRFICLIEKTTKLRMMAYLAGFISLSLLIGVL